MADATLGIGVVGAGTMGAGIAQVALEAGHAVTIHDPVPGAIDRARTVVADGLARRARRRFTDRAEAAIWVETRLRDLSVAPDLGALATDRGLLIEAVTEDLDAKVEVFEALDRAAPGDAVLATNTSALSVAALGAATRRPDRVCGLHFFSPVPLMRLVEVASTAATDPVVTEGLVALMVRWGKAPIRCVDVPGFVVNRVNRPFTLEALSIVEAGAASMDDVDTAILTAGYPMGPFELMDHIGLDVNLATSRAIHTAVSIDGDPLAERFRPSALQERLVADGYLGRKSGRGFRSHPRADTPATRPTPTGLAPDIAERVNLAIVLEAFRTVDAGIATESDIDQALRDGAGHPVGPFERTRDLGGRQAVETLVRERGYAGPRFSLAPRA